MPPSNENDSDCLWPGPFVVQRDREPAVEERHHLQALGDRRVAELDLLEHVGVGPERDARAGVPALRLRDDLQLSLRHARASPRRAPPSPPRTPGGRSCRRGRPRARRASTARSRPTRRRRADRPTPCSRRRRTCRPRAAWSSRSRPPTCPCTAGARRRGCRGRCRRRARRRRRAATRRCGCRTPAMASSTALSTTSQTRWCRPARAGRTDVHARAVCGPGRGPRAPGCARRSSRRRTDRAMRANRR